MVAAGKIAAGRSTRRRGSARRPRPTFRHPSTRGVVVESRAGPVAVAALIWGVPRSARRRSAGQATRGP